MGQQVSTSRSRKKGGLVRGGAVNYADYGDKNDVLSFCATRVIIRERFKWRGDFFRKIQLLH